MTNTEAVRRYRATDKGRATHRDYQRRWAAEHPEAIAQRGLRYRQAHADERRAGQDRFYEANPDYIRARNLKRFGLSIDDYNRMFEAQGGRCAICGVHQSELKKALHVDHDHERDIVRGLLCNHCNLVLGHAHDSARVLVVAAAYLEAE